MKAVARLIATYYTGTPLVRWVTIVSIIAIAIGIGEFYFFPEFLFGRGAGKAPIPIVQSVFMWAVPLIGIWGVFFGGVLMPKICWQFIRGHRIQVLPCGRLKLICSALGTATLVALSVAIVVTGMFKAVPNTDIDLADVFRKSFVVSALSSTFMYVIVWFIATSRSTFVLLSGLMIVIPGLVVPLGFVSRPAMSIRWPLAVLLVIWALFIAC